LGESKDIKMQKKLKILSIFSLISAILFFFGGIRFYYRGDTTGAVISFIACACFLLTAVGSYLGFNRHKSKSSKNTS